MTSLAAPSIVLAGPSSSSAAPAAGADQSQFVAAVLDECSKVIKQLIMSKFADGASTPASMASTDDLTSVGRPDRSERAGNKGDSGVADGGEDASQSSPAAQKKVPPRTSIIATEKVIAEITASQADSLVTMLCEIIEQIFNYGLRLTEGTGRGRAAFWSYVAQCDLPDGQEAADDRTRILRLEDLKTDVGRGRSFIRLAVEKKMLADHLEECLKDNTLLDRLYKEYAFVRSEEARFTLMSRLAALRSVDIHSFSSKNYSGESNVYHVNVYTSDMFRAGTSANTFLSLEGRDGRTGTVCLEGQFERGSIDQFDVSSSFLGPLHTITIGHDNSGFQPGWFLEKVVVEHMPTGRVYEFMCRRWFALDEDDGQIVRELKVTNVTTRAQMKAAEQAAQAAALTTILANKLAAGAFGGLGETFSKTLTRSFSLKTPLSASLSATLSSSPSMSSLSKVASQTPSSPTAATTPAPAAVSSASPWTPPASASTNTAPPSPAQPPASALPAPVEAAQAPLPRPLRREPSLLREETSRRVSSLVMAALGQRTLNRSVSLPVSGLSGQGQAAFSGPQYGYPSEPPRTLVEMKDLDCDATLLQLRQAIKAVVDHFESPNESKSQDDLGNSDVDPTVSMVVRMGLATALEQTMHFGFKSSRLFGTPYRIWQFIEKVERPDKRMTAEEEATPEYAAEMSFFEIVDRIKAHPYSAYDAKFRAFICYGLNLRMLHYWIQILANNPQTVKWFDKGSSFMRSPTLFQLFAKQIQRFKTYPFYLSVTADLPEPQLIEDPNKPPTPSEAVENETTTTLRTP
eukprot:Opistho-2@31027